MNSWKVLVTNLKNIPSLLTVLFPIIVNRTGEVMYDRTMDILDIGYIVIILPWIQKASNLNFKSPYTGIFIIIQIEWYELLYCCHSMLQVIIIIRRFNTRDAVLIIIICEPWPINNYKWAVLKYSKLYERWLYILNTTLKNISIYNFPLMYAKFAVDYNHPQRWALIVYVLRMPSVILL